ncbi:MAG: Uma2 family endonuclease [Bryobacterales bacterium]|nr:Uma2 family endonuclease [Bryobacterales bacterium]
MAVKTPVSEEEYLRTSFGDRAPEYVHGELVERTLPNKSHSKAQVELAFAFKTLQARLPLFPFSELRVPVAPGKYRIVDVAVYARQEPKEELPEELPLVVAEIVSPEDGHEDLMRRLEEFRTWGVPHIWLVDSGLRRLYVYRHGRLEAVNASELPEFGVQIPVAQVLPEGAGGS